MTAVKPRHPVSSAGAMTRILGLLGLSAAEAIGKSASLVYKFADPDHDSEPSFSQIEALDAAYAAAGGEGHPLTETLLKRLAGRAGTHIAKSPLSRFLEVTREAGDLSLALESALEDNEVTPAEALRIQNELAQLIEVATKMSRDVDAMAKAASGKVSERGGE